MWLDTPFFHVTGNLVAEAKDSTKKDQDLPISQDPKDQTYQRTMDMGKRGEVVTNVAQSIYVRCGPKDPKVARTFWMRLTEPYSCRACSVHVQCMSCTQPARVRKFNWPEDDLLEDSLGLL